MLQPLIRVVPTVIIAITHVGLEHAASVVALEEVGRAFRGAAGRRLVGQVLAVGGAWG